MSIATFGHFMSLLPAEEPFVLVFYILISFQSKV